MSQKSETEWLLAFQNKIQTQKASHELLFILTHLFKLKNIILFIYLFDSVSVFK